MSIHSRLFTIEDQLLFHPEIVFSHVQYNHLVIEITTFLHNQPTHHIHDFCHYLLGVIAYSQGDILMSTTHLNKCHTPSHLPTRSQAFFNIYRTLILFENQPELVHKQLIKQRTSLTISEYAFLLTKLIVASRINPAEHARSFYWNLQLLEILPTLPETLFTAQIYYEFGIFYVFMVQNITLAEANFQKSLALLTTNSTKERALIKMISTGMAYVATINNDFPEAITNYQKIISEPFTNDIDVLHYYKVLINALNVYLKIGDLTMFHQYFPQIADITSLEDYEKRQSLLFSSNILNLNWLLAQPEIDTHKISQISEQISIILPQLKQNFAFGFPQITWARMQGYIHLKYQNFTKAQQYFAQQLELSLMFNQINHELSAHFSLSEVAKKLGNFDLAVHHFKIADTLQTTIFQESNRYFLTSLHAQIDNRAFETEMIEQKLSNKMLEQTVIRDQLTKLFNRHYLTNLYSQLPLAHPLHLAIIDIDYFKQYNDYYGHLKGDDLLKTFAELLLQVFAQETVIRYGGEEFLILRSNCPIKEFIAVLNQFQTELQSLALAHQGVAENHIVTASIGYTTAQPEQLQTMKMAHHALDIADQALYQAKSTGRNQICYQPMPPNNVNAKKTSATH
ncbi:MAG: GGDEF domain-containing protein [Culicoidibacterales bacterium]